MNKANLFSDNYLLDVYNLAFGNNFRKYVVPEICEDKDMISKIPKMAVKSSHLEITSSESSKKLRILGHTINKCRFITPNE